MLFSHGLFSQNVGINATGVNPDNSAMLDIVSSDKGILIPRVNIANLSTAAPVTAPSNSLLVFNTNATTGQGYYYWDNANTTWVKLLDANSNSDEDWHKANTTNSPTSINDDIFTNGNVGIGLNNPSESLEVIGRVKADSYEGVGNNGGGAGGNAIIRKNANAGRDELQIYSGGDAYQANSKGAGIHLYGNFDSQHAGNVAHKSPTQKNINALYGKTLTIEANALMNVVPDAQIAIFSLIQLGETALETTEIMASRIDPIKKELIKLGIEKENIVLDMISFIPRYEDTIIKKRFSKSFTEIPKGFELKKNLHIKFKDHELLEKIITICAKSEVYELAKIEYVVLDNEAHQKRIREELLHHISDKIAFYHKLTIHDEIKIYQVNEQTNEYYPMDRYKMYAAHSSSSFEAVTAIKKKKQRTVKRLEKNKTIFYDPINTKSYDVIINPGVLKPSVQYSFKITVSYKLVEKEKQEVVAVEKDVIKKQYLLITPAGDVKALDL